jgi:ribosomal protein L9
VTVHIKGGENGKTYGSVSTKELAEAVKEQLGLELDKKKIALAEPIKNFGSYETVVKLHRDVQATLKVNVTEAK